MAESVWRRCSEYVIEQGIIRPAPGARVESYNPWRADREAASEEERPYKVLLRLAQRSKTRRPEALGKRQSKLLARWLAANGLLGLLPHETLQYYSPPRWQKRSALLQPAGGPTFYVPQQRCVRRCAEGWSVRTREVGPERPAASVVPGAPVEPELLYETAHPVETLYRSWPSGEIKHEALAVRWRDYFPGSTASTSGADDYPDFTDEEFWLSYGEPLEAFLGWSRRLASSLALLVEEGDGEQQWGREGAMMALAEINEAAFGTSLGGYPREDGSVGLGRAAPSLASCFALLILHDLAAGQQVMRCPICDGVFLSRAYQARFCSAACRYAHHKRQQREADKPRRPAPSAERPSEKESS